MAVDDDPAVLSAITRDLQARYAEDYQVVSMPSAPPALARLGGYALKDRPVAMIISDQRMPTMTGIELLERAKREAPEAKLVLLTAYADTDVAITAINEIKLDRYLMKPWDPPDDKLYPALDDLLDDWQRNHPDDRAPVRIVGHRWSDRSHELKTFLARNYVPYRWLDLERDEEAQRLHDLAHALPNDLPLVLVTDGDPLRSPTTLRRRVRARTAHERREAAVRPLHRRRRARRARGRGVWRVRGARRRARRGPRARRPGRPERSDRELPRVPPRPVRC